MGTPITDQALVALLYDCVGEGMDATPFLAALGRAYGDGAGVRFLHDFRERQAMAMQTAHLRADSESSYNRYYTRLNPWLAAARDWPIGVARNADAIVLRSEFLKTEFYADWCRPQGIGASVGVIVQQDCSRALAVSVLCGPDLFERDPDAVGRLQRLVPHLLRVTQLERQLARLRARAEAAETALEGRAIAMLLVDGHARVVFLTDEAERIVTEGDGISGVRNTLAALRSREAVLLSRLIAGAAQARRNPAAVPGGVMRVSRLSGRRDYELLVSPVGEGLFRFEPSGALVAVFVRDHEQRAMSRLDRLRQLHGLSAAEARVMQALLAGDTLNGIAERFDVSKETVRSQLRAVFLKTETASQAELVRLGAGSLAAVGASEGADGEY